MNVVFFGSTDFALPTLQALQAQTNLCLVVAHPDTRKGRGRKAAAPPARIFAEENGIPCLQADQIRTGQFFDAVAVCKPAFLVIADYGKKIPDALIDLPFHATLNIHPSLLPRHRGPSPIPYAILSGDRATGISIIGLTDEIDAGPLYAQCRTEILPDETAEELSARLAPLGADLMIEAMQGVAEGRLQPREQDHARSTYAPMLTKADGLLDFTRPVTELVLRVRALQPWPMAHCTLPLTDVSQGLRVNIHRATPEMGDPGAPVGTVLSAQKTGIRIAAAGGALIVGRLQPAGKRPMGAEQFLNGYMIEVGMQVHETQN